MNDDRKAVRAIVSRGHVGTQNRHIGTLRVEFVVEAESHQVPRIEFNVKVGSVSGIVQTVPRDIVVVIVLIFIPTESPWSHRKKSVNAKPHDPVLVVGDNPVQESAESGVVVLVLFLECASAKDFDRYLVGKSQGL